MSITVTNLTKLYGHAKVVNNLNLNIESGKLVSLLGVNGAGKTTTIKMLTGILKPTSGTIVINNMDMREEAYKIKEIINVSPQETAIATNLTVKENLEFMASVYGIQNKKQKINELVEQFKLHEVLNKKANILSGGWKRKVSIALSLINDPKILFLDEPTLGLDVVARKELWKLISQLKGKITIILTTHYMEEAEYLSDRVAIMCDGCLIDMGTPEELIKKTNTSCLEDAFVSIVAGREEQ